MSATRIYLVRNTDDHGGAPAALIRASSSAQASRHFMMRNFEVTVPSQDELIAAIGAELSVEDATPVPTEG